MSQYVYEPLLPQQIRLLNISQGLDRLQIISCDLESAPAYSTISYSWNNEPCDHLLQVDGFYLKAIRNIMLGLPQLIEKASTSYLWIDAICINQSDDDEKGYQVPLMKDIYTKCQECLVWLGDGTPESDFAVDAIPRIVQQFSMQDPADVWTAEGMGTTSDNVLQLPLWKGLAELFSRPWFKRLWTFQEAVLPTVLVFICGSRTIACSDMEGIAVPLLNHLTLLELVYPKSDFEDSSLFVGFLKMIRVFRYRTIGPMSRTAADSIKLLYTTGPWRTTNRLDKIYGILGLADSSLQDFLVVNYHKSQVDVSRELAAWYLLYGEDLFLLHLASAERKKKTLPSWIPNFAGFGSHWCRGSLWRTYKTGMERGASIRPLPTRLSDELHVLGIRVDQVQAIVPNVAQPHNLEINKCVSILDWEAKCLALSKSTTGSNKPGVPDAHWKTILATIWDYYLEEPTKDGYNNLMTLVKAVANQDTGAMDLGMPNQVLAAQIRRLSQTQNRGKFFSTVGGRVGLGPSMVQPGDQICILYRGFAPFILRPTADDGQKFRLVGDSYVSGIMHGEVFEADSRPPDETLVLV